MIEPGTMRAQEAIESLTGFEIIGIEERFGTSWEDLSSTKTTYGLLAMLHKREGMNAKDAWQTALSMPLKQLNEFFAPEPEVEIDGEPEDEPGKG